MTELLHPNARVIDAATGEVVRDLVRPALFADVPPGVVFLRMPTCVESVVHYVTAFETGRPVALLDPGLTDETLLEFVERFEPAAVFGPVPQELPKRYQLAGDAWVRETAPETAPHPDLAVLLATSGSTGDPKFVRLSRRAVLSNTDSIIEALGITAAEVAISTLPFYYSYGMSVLNTHLAAGAAFVVEAEGLLGRGFWPAVDEFGVSSLALVPSQYEMLVRLRFDPTRYPALRTLTQAGGRLRPELVRDFHERMAAVGGRLFVMYGQTEAAPRLTTLPAGRLGEKLGSVGPAVPGGRLSIRLADGTETTAPDVSGEVLYRGPNVMLGYAETAADLAHGDVAGGLLVTGDLGRLDGDGYLFLEGRIKRFGKVFGVRLNLDDIERMLPVPAAAVSCDDGVVVFVAQGEPFMFRRSLADRLKLHWSGFDVRSIEAFPLLSNGKVDYRALEALR
ncbi:AMP-binding protein [Dactylosporangium matsuzakiense]|uniref:AMP-dependent acyl-CoA synthetase n=1 Tax=Dactylosporangium matsuzakiense TaxID=53360 RepID=A0A9W6KQ22_9ACTN|nr:AMP-binding protein [Dactylosporangium matsuzakiense]UWZ44751.1 AMP-binding protein [Dactylosporangium matsuzakiense]GLL06002.1 AMP-dependent acyl-CoA synthetase [Dactylosporangium matsuzakiense]